MPEGPTRGGRGEGDVRDVARRVPRIAGATSMLVVLAATAVLGYDHRRADLRDAWAALPDGKLVMVSSSGFPGPHSLVTVGQHSAAVRPFPPVLRRSTSLTPARGPGGLAMSPDGWMLIRLAQLGRDTEGGQITEISPSGALIATLPLLHWRDAAIVGITDAGLAVFRRGTGLYFVGAFGEPALLLDLSHLGVARDLSNLADVALAPDGGLAVLVRTGAARDGYLVYQRHPGGASHRVMRVGHSDLYDPLARSRPHGATGPAVSFAGGDIVVAGNAGLVRFRDGRSRGRLRIDPADRARLRPAPSTLVSMPGGRWAIGNRPLAVLDRSGRFHHPGYGPCPAEQHIRRHCPAVLAGHRVPLPDDILPEPAVAALGVGLTLLAALGRFGRSEGARIRLTATILGAAWVTTWLCLSLAWGDLHGAAPLLLLAGATAAILAPAFPASEPRERDDLAVQGRTYEHWVSDRIAGRTAGAGGGRRLEVIPLPSRS